MKKVRIGLVGTGGMGKVHYANIQALDSAEVVAVVGSSERSGKQAEEWGLPFFSTITEMVNTVAPDMVDICTPTDMHHDMVLESLRCGIDTICEKPIALSYEDAKEMLDTAAAMKKHLYIAQVLQFTKEVQILRETVQSGALGKPLDAVFERLSACPRWAAGGWLFDKKRSGQLYYDLHIHDLDVIVSTFGIPDSFRFTSCRSSGKSYPEDIRVTYQYGDMQVVGEAAWFNANIPWTARWRVYFEQGMLINDEHGLILYRFDHEPQKFDIVDDVMISTGINVPPCGWYYNELKHFVECHLAGIDTPLIPAGRLLSVMKLLEEISAE